MAGDDDNHSLSGDSPPGSPAADPSQLPLHPSSLSGGTQADETGAESTAVDALLTLAVPEVPRAVAAGTKRVHAPEDDGDMTQYVGMVARHVKLRKTDHDELLRASKLSERERSLFSLAKLMKMQEQLEVIQPGNTVWEIPKLLYNEIEHYTYAILCSSALPVYVADHYPEKIIIKILEANPSWGYTSEVKNNIPKRDIVASRARGRLTDRRSSIKTAILLSLGTELLTTHKAMHLVRQSGKAKAPTPEKLNILQLVAEVAALHKSAPVRVTLEVCARIAYLRRRLLKLIEVDTTQYASYWVIVDKKLFELRSAETAAQISRTFVRALREDQKTFGVVDDNEYVVAPAAGSDEDMVNTAAQDKPIPSNAPFLSS